ncbi:serine/threonine protein kinase [Sandaracinus amylolyticus]|uniref:Serine/threonine protein kinase n=1 Tax=Sandaracinus amylolyticus TaxID=927083 RepID=A0A0F6SG43_9BACT|nr:serine/threonine protein kinase [Sandaracinus amylolyticus]
MGRDQPGRRIAGKYELVERAGEGGMATVWRAITLGAEGFERPVALKRAHPALAIDPQFVAMFVEEARVNATLDHPNIVHIHDFGSDEHGEHYLVMEWVEGLDLRRLVHAHALVEEQVAWPIAVAIVVEVLRGIYAAHTRETPDGDAAPIFHRDVTPQNVMLAVSGAVKITDFGLARATDRARVTNPGTVKGKLGYLAPELTLDHPPSALTDLFGVGIVLWETLAGERLFDGASDVEILQKVARASVPPIMAIRPDVPPALAEAVHTALARDPAHRFPDVRAMGLALRRVLRDHLDEAPDMHAIAMEVRDAREQLGLGTGRRSVSSLDVEHARRVRAALFGTSSDERDASGAIPLELSRKKH